MKNINQFIKLRQYHKIILPNGSTILMANDTKVEDYRDKW